MSDIEVLDELGPVQPDEGASDDASSGIDPASLPATLVDPDSLPPIVQPPPVQNRGRFRVSLVVLAGIAVAAVAIAVAVAANGNTHAGVASTNWSRWHPSSSGPAGVDEIAQHVAPYYRSNETTQLNVVTPLAVTSTSSAGVTTGKGLTVAVDTSTKSSSSASSGGLELLSGNTVAYNVCGLGSKNCALSGTPSASRLLLLRREALELALYTFKYVSGTDNVLVVLPPGRTEATSGKKASGPTKPVTVTVLFVKQELQQSLNVPLSHTLALYPPDLSELLLWSKSSEAELVDEITASGLFSEEIESQQEGGRILVLSQLSSQ